MTSDRQLQYLKVMGIDTWVRRSLDTLAESDAPADKVATAPAEPELEARVERAASQPEAPTGARPHTSTQPVTKPSADAWQQLADSVASCQRCPLHRERTQTVFGVGNRQAAVMVIGEAPGYHEDRQGEPFVGRAGSLLNCMLQAIGFDRGSVYIANVLKCRPPNNRDPQGEETAECAAYLQQQIEMVDPQVLLAVGRISAQHLLASDAPIGRLRGRVHQLPGRDLPVVVTYHPAYLLRSPEQKGKAMADLMLLQEQLRRQQVPA